MTGAPVDYRNRDYAGLRRMLLDQLAADLPGWQDGNPADLGVALTELFAYLGDHLSYAQDSAATEAYLGTARFRESVRRHARMLDYALHEGAAARTWLAVTGDGVTTLGTGLEVSTPGGESVFHTLHPVTVRRSRNAVEVYTGGAERAELAAGATTARLVGARDDLALRAGDVLVFEDAGAARTCVVRLTEDPFALDDPDSVVVTWHAQDAPRTPMRLWRVPTASGGVAATTVVRGNVVLAEHGRLVAGEPVVPPTVPATGRYRPRLARPGLAHAVPYDHADAVDRPASDALVVDPALAVPAMVELDDEVSTWQVRADLVASGRSAADYVVERAEDGTARLRFGDGHDGRAPVPGTVLRASYRIGGGPAGNVGAGALTELVAPVAGVRVRNCVPAVGGVAAQPIEQARLLAPHGSRVLARAVTEADHSEIAMRHPSVARAWSVRRWTGSWHTVTTVVDPPEGVVPDTAQIAEFIGRHTMAGEDVRVVAAVAVPLDIRLTVRIRPGAAPAEVLAGLRDAFTAGTRRDGRPGFFHPDAFSFADPVHLSRVVAAATAVPGVWWVDTSDDPVVGNRFHRWGTRAEGELAVGTIVIGEHEVVSCVSDPDRPELGAIDFVLGEAR
ncbi:baseplate J/gp47 family protein [Actinophytocola oryzae]|uniref:Putative phage baseplate assembly protein n=1 Tax=Actinophytocola oryzae TaxID=502181 RepID=A0A4R7VI62_9PSEU|nr:baseplate J/gp47 family protein [Actinophytocola oryzae]TDV48768.1 putative phage baseplate assembly protein [Actinophytocola oryzae]